MPTHPVIAVDGPAASGKSTVSKRLAAQLGLAHVDTGSMFRAMTLAAIRAGINPAADPAAAARLPESVDLRCEIAGGACRVLLDGADPGADARRPSVNELVSHVAAIPAVRIFLIEMQRALAERAPLVMEGRDIGSVVFPDTPWRYYLDASPAVRARRRSDQGQQDSIAERDRLDSTRAAAPLAVAPGAIVIDTSDVPIPDVLTRILADLAARDYPLLSAA